VDDLWTILLPLIVANAVLPLQIVVTILLLRSDGGRLAAFAWIGGMTLVRLAQGVIFGMILGVGVQGTDVEDGPGPVESTLLLLVAIAFLVLAAKKALNVPDDDAPPPRWMTLVTTAGPSRAFLLGAGMVVVSAKLWAFTLAAIGAIAEAGLDQPAAVTSFLIYAVGAVGLHLGMLAGAVLAPARADVVLTRFSAALERYDRPIMIAVSLVFGMWFLLKALDGFGIL
jgi:Sap, sulfolipid-1-addressing protein